MTYRARGNVVELGGGNRGQGDDGSDGEGLHFGGYFGDLWIGESTKVNQ
jgi:hypothetical protein